MTKTTTSTDADDTLEAFVAQNKSKPVLFSHIKVVVDTIFQVLKAINEKNVMRNAKIEALEQRCAELESTVALAVERVKSFEERPGVPYDGIWDPTKAYSRGVFVTCSGSLWHSESASISRRPGTDPTIWKLAVKRGADAKHADARP